MGSRFVRTDWGPNDIALLNHELDRINKELGERPVIVEQEFTSSGLTAVRHPLGVKVKGIMVLSGNVQEPSAGDRDTWDRDTIRLRCDGTFPQNVVLALWGSGEERFQKVVTSGANQGTSGQVAVVDADNTNLEFIDQSTLVSGSAPAAHASSHLPAATDPIDFAGRIIMQGAYGDMPAASASNAGCLYYATDYYIVYRSDGATWLDITVQKLLDLATVLGLGNAAGGYDIDFELTNGPINVLFEDFGLSLPSYTSRRYGASLNTLYGPKGVGNTYMPMSFPPSTAARMMLMGGS